jgi:hypothetical protein
MTLRPELTPPALDAVLVARLAHLAATLDGAVPGQWEDDLAEFNRLAGTAIPFEEFQGIYGGEEHEVYVRRVLYRRLLTPDPALTPEEMTDIVSRVMTCGDDRDFYLELFLVNCKHPSGTDLIYWPNLVPELPQGRDPTAEEVASLALEKHKGRIVVRVESPDEER